MPTSQWNPRTDARSTIRYVDVSGVTRDELRIVSVADHSSASAPSRARKIVNRDDTIFATVRPTLRRIAQVQECHDGAMVSTAFCVLRPNSELMHPDFLFFVMQLESVMDEVAAMQTGASYPAVRDVDVMSLKVPVPPLSDQCSIADALNLARSAILGQRRCEEATQALNRAAMHALFTRGLRGEVQKETEIGPVPESWEVKAILDICDIWSGGTPRKSVAEYWKGSIPWVSGKDLKSPSLCDTIDHVTDQGIEASSRLAPTGAVLLLVRGMGLANDLPVAVINRPMAFNQDVKALVPRCDYSGRFLRSAVYVGKERLLGRIVTSAHGTMTLNLKDVERLKVPCPLDRAEADGIVAILDAIDRKIDLHRRKRTVLEELFKSLLHKLMTGEIRMGELDISVLLGNTTQSKNAERIGNRA